MLLLNLFEASSKKQEFVVLEHYQSQLARIGYHHTLYLDLMVTLGKHSILTPSPECIQTYF